MAHLIIIIFFLLIMFVSRDGLSLQFRTARNLLKGKNDILFTQHFR